MTAIDIHIIQSVPPSNLNRDVNGSPKTAMYGGTRRARVSSQAWKMATRQAYRDLLDPKDLGQRTKRVAELLADRIQTLRPEASDEEAAAGAWHVLTALGFSAEKEKKGKGEGPANTQYLVFFSNPQLDALAELAVANELEALTTREAKAQAKAVVKQDHGVTLSLFGRMIANDADLNVDASVQVAHALSTHAVDHEFDFYTAVDEHNPNDETGAGMMGTIEFNSSTLYRYATISVEALQDNIGDAEATARAVEVFLKAFATSMPSGKQNTFGNGTLPHGVVVVAHEGQGVNWVGAFEDAVAANGGGFVEASCVALTQHARDLADAFGEDPLAAWVTAVGSKAESLAALGTAVPLPDMVASVGDFVRGRLGEHS